MSLEATSVSSAAFTRSTPVEDAGVWTDRAGGATELDQLLGRLNAGVALSPVENGTLARLMDNQPQATPDGRAFADTSGGGADAPGGSVTAPAASVTDTGAVAGAKTTGDFTVTNGSAQDVADLSQALSYLQSANADGTAVSSTAAALLAALPPGATINIVHNGADQYDPNTGVIDWDPRSGLVVTSGQGTQSAALGLVHEVDHEVAGQANPTPTGDGYENTEEQRVIQGSETTIANDFHEPTRTDHGGTTENLGSSSDHTYWNGGTPPPVSPDIPGLNGGDPGSGYTPPVDTGGAGTDPGTPANPDPGVTDPGVTNPGNPPPFSPDIPGLGDGSGGYGPGDGGGSGAVDGGGGGGGGGEFGSVELD